MHSYPPSANILNEQDYYYNSSELHQQSNNNSDYIAQCHDRIMVPNELFSLSNPKMPQTMSNLSQDHPPPSMYYIPSNVPFSNNSSDVSDINHSFPPPTSSSCSDSASTINTATITTDATSIFTSSLPSLRQPHHNSLMSNKSTSPVNILEAGKEDTSNNPPRNKREKALERNRQAALRCRQRKREWLNQLQYNVEALTRENRILEHQSLYLREEILNLKTILLTHRDCSVSKMPGSLDIEKAI